MRTGIIFRNSPKMGSGTARHRTPGRRRDAGPFSRFIFDPTSIALKKFGNPGSGRFPLVTLFVCLKKNCSVFLFPHLGIQSVTQFQIRNTLSTAEGSLPAAVFGGGWARPAYRLYPASFSTHRKFAKMPRQFLAVASLSPYGVTSLASAENPTQACHGPCRAEILAYPARMPGQPPSALYLPYPSGNPQTLAESLLKPARFPVWQGSAGCKLSSAVPDDIPARLPEGGWYTADSHFVHRHRGF